MFTSHARNSRTWSLWSLSLALVAGAAVAQGLPDMAGMKEAVQKQQRANEEALRHYNWKSRTEVRVGGEVKSTVLQSVRYGADGEVQKTVIGSQKAQEKRKLMQFTPVGALVKQIKTDKADKFKDGLRKLLESYSDLPPDKMQAFFARASFQPGKDAMQGTLRIFGTGVVKPDDTLSIWIDMKTREKKQVEVLTWLDGDPVQVVSHFGKLDDGTMVTKRTTVDVRPKNLMILTENYDFTRGNAP